MSFGNRPDDFLFGSRTDGRQKRSTKVKICNKFQNAWRCKTMKKAFLVLYQPGPAWISGISVFEQPLEAHGSYVQKLYRAGKVRFAGPFTDSSGGASLLELEGGETEARAIAENDPAVTAGIFTITIYPWHLVSWEQYGKTSS